MADVHKYKTLYGTKLDQSWGKTSLRSSATRISLCGSPGGLIAVLRFIFCNRTFRQTQTKSGRREWGLMDWCWWCRKWGTLVMERIVILVILCYMCHSPILTDSPTQLSASFDQEFINLIISDNCINIFNIFTAIFHRLIKFVMTCAKIG